MEPRTSIRGTKAVALDDFYLIKDAETGEIHFPSALVGETIGQLAAWNVMHATDFQFRPVAGIAQQARIHRLVAPGETLLLQANIENLDEKAVQYNGLASVNEEIVFELEGAIGPLLPMQDFAEPTLVQSQFAEIYHPNKTPQQINAMPFDSILEGSWANRHFVRDRMLSHQAGEEMSILKLVTRGAPYFPDHFPKKPVLPLTVLLEIVAHAATEFAKDFPTPAGWRVSGLNRVKMIEFVQPGDCLVIKMSVKQALQDGLTFKVVAFLSERRVCHLECHLSPKGM